MSNQSMSDEEQAFAHAVTQSMKPFLNQLTSPQIIGTLRLVAAAVEARYTGGELVIQVLIAQEDDEGDEWKQGLN